MKGWMFVIYLSDKNINMYKNTYIQWLLLTVDLKAKEIFSINAVEYIIHGEYIIENISFETYTSCLSLLVFKQVITVVTCFVFCIRRIIFEWMFLIVTPGNLCSIIASGCYIN